MVKNIRTYQSDLSEALKDQKGSVVKIALAEHKRKEQEKKNISPKSTKNTFFIWGGILLMAISAIIIIFLFINKKSTLKNFDSINPEGIQSLIFADNHKEIEAKNFSKRKMINAITNEVENNSLRLDTIENIYLTTSVNESEKQIVGAKNFLSLIGNNIPNSLLRAIENDFMIGIYSFDNSQLFILLKTLSYDNAFAGLLLWEDKLFDDLYEIFKIDTSGENANLFNKKFQDMIVQNKDARVLKNDQGEIILMYIFLNKQTIIITRDEDTLVEVSNRLNIKKNVNRLIFKR